MYRTGSSTRVSDEFFNPSLSASDDVQQQQQLPTYNSESHVANKEKNRRVKSYANVIHFIPVLLLVCGLILWLFSYPVDMSNKGNGTRRRI